MTLVVAITTGRGTWVGGERMAGDFDYTELAGPKVFKLETDDGRPFAVGLAGHPRVAQVMLAVEPPPRRREEASLHWWLTEYCDQLLQRCADRLVLCDAHNGDPSHAAGGTGMVLAIEGRVFLIDSHLSWEEPKRGYVATGGAFETFNGAYEVLRDHHEPIEAARRAWPYVQRRHRIGHLEDEICG